MPKRKAVSGDVDSEVTPKIQKGTVVDLFSTSNVDITTEKSKYETYTQSQITMEPLDISVLRTRSWIDMTKVLFEYEVEFMANDGTTPLTNAAKVFPVNSTGHSLIKQFQVSINKDAVGETTDTYHLEAYLDRLLNHSEAEKSSLLSLEGWATYTPGSSTIPTLYPAWFLLQEHQQPRPLSNLLHGWPPLMPVKHLMKEPRNVINCVVRIVK